MWSATTGRACIAGRVTVLALLTPACARSARQSERPNVLFIAVDDLNDWSSVLGGHSQAVIPSLDRLAERGITFTNAYTAAAACNPSRTALLTGLPPYRTGIYENWVPWREYLPDAALAIVESGPADDTVVVLWSDHGWQLGEKTHWRKYALWENVARVHLMISVPPGAPGLPEGTRAGLRSRRAVSLQDIYPTLIDLASDPNEWTNLAGDPEHAAAKDRLKALLPSSPAPKVVRDP